MNVVNEKNLGDYLIEYETGELAYVDVVDLFQYLVDTGLAWELQGSYGRMAKMFLDEGRIQPARRLVGGDNAAKTDTTTEEAPVGEGNG